MLLHIYLVAIVFDIVFKAKVFIRSDHGIATRTNRDVISAPTCLDLAGSSDDVTARC